jgi:hypothetical protein
VLQVNKNEWETFLSEFSALTKNYELILSKLELAHTQMKELNQRNEALTRELRRAVGSASSHAMESNDEREEIGQKETNRRITETKPTVESKPGFLGSLRNRLNLSTRKSQNLISGYASCRRCGFLIRRASRFCVGCGIDFGTFVCPCGRGLSSADKFCDRCGRVTGFE